MKKKCAIFGAGERGTNAIKKLTLFFEVIAYSDNNSKLWRNKLNGIEIVPPNDLPKLIDETGAVIFIANALHAFDIAEQLDALGLSDYYNCENNFCYKLDRGVWYPISFGKPNTYKKIKKNKFAVLFVQMKPCTRTNKIAEVLKNKGVLTYSAYVLSPSDVGAQAYIEEFPIWTYADLLDFVNESDFDIIHCSNEPDILVNVLIHSNKKVIHDCHDIATMSKKNYHTEEVVLEYIANTQADGVMCPTERVKEILLRKYGGNPDNILVIGNYPLASFKYIQCLPKLSAIDGKFHCVYEGYIVSDSSSKEVGYRFFEPIFKQLSEMGIHVHIYSSNVPQYLEKLDNDYENIHYEGNYSGEELITKMTQYDFGLLLYPLEGRTYVELSSPNKMTEYFAAGLPVITNIKTYADILIENNCGGKVNLEKDDIVSKLEKYKKFKISLDFCDTHGFTMDSNFDKIFGFYKKVLAQ